MARDFSAELFGAPKKEEQPSGKDFSAALFGAIKEAPAAAPALAPAKAEAQPVTSIEEMPSAPATPEELATAAQDIGSPITDLARRSFINALQELKIGPAGVFRALGEQASGVYQRTPAGRFYQAITGTIGEKDPGAAFADVMAESARQAEALKEKPPEDQGLVARGIESGVQSFAQNLALLPMALLPGGQAATLTAFGGITGGSAYQQAREKGLSPQEALPFATSQGVIEVATEGVPLTKLLEDINKKTGFGRMLLNQIKKEIPGEQLATVLQDLNEWAVLNPDKPFADYVAERPSAAAETLIATVVGTGGNVIVGKAMQKGAEKFAGLQTEEEKTVANILKDLDKAAADETATEETRLKKIRTAFADGFEKMYGKKPTDDELDQMVDEYETKRTAATAADTSGRIEPSFQVPGAPTDMGGAAAEPGAAGPGGMALSGVPPSGAGTGTQPAPSPLSNQFTIRPESTPQEKSSAKHYAALQKQPDNPVTQSLAALDTSIQKAKDAYAQIAETLGIPSGQDMIGLGVRLPTPLGNLLNYPSASGSAVRLVNASKDFTSGAKRGSQAKVDSALKQVQGEVSNVDKIIADAFAAAEDPAVQAEINRLNEQLAVNKGVAARQAEIASVPMEQRADKIKQIEDEIRAGLKTKKAKVVDLTPKLEAKEDAELEAGILEDEQRRGQAALTKEVNAEIQEALNLARQALAENSTIEKRGPTFFPEDTTAAKQFAASVAQIYEGLEKGTLPNATRSIENLRNEAANIKASLQQRIADREAYEKRSRPDLKLVSKAPTAQELEDTGAIFENELEPAKDFFTGDNDVYGVDTEGNTTKLANPEELAAFHEANKDKAEPDFTAGDAGYYVVPRERAAPATVPDAPTIKENNDAVEELNYRTARDNFLNGQFDVYHIDPEENVTPVTSLKQLQQLNAEWQGDPDAGFWSVPKAKPAEVKFASKLEAQAMEQMLQAGKMNPAVLTALANNDLNGALRLIADRTKGFYGDLARVLSELNLPTLVVLNNPSVLIRRQIDRVVGPQQFRLFDYVQRTYPDVYAKYFKNYDREENLEKVHEGLRFLKDKNYNMGPVIAEFEDVTGAFNKNIKGLVLPGFYAPEFDAISLDTASATNDVLLHEVLHASTAAVIDADPATLTEGQRAALKQLTEMFEYAKAQIPLNLYGFTDLHEFVSELFTNKSFRERLQKIQYQPTRQSLLTSIARTIYRLFGINNLAGNAMAQATQLFSAVRAKRPIPIGLRFANAPRRGRARGPVTNNWRAQEDYGDTLVKLIKKMMVSGKPWPTISKDVGKALFRAKYSGLRRIVLPNLGLRHLADLTKFGFPQLSGAVRIVEQMLAYRQRSMTKAADIVKDWMKLKQISAPMERLMSRIMVEATIRRIDPDTATATDLPPSDPLARAWDKLPDGFREVYRRARNYYSDALKETINEMKARIMQSGKPLSEKKALLRELNRQFGPDKLVKPYFPLRRFGQYWFQVGKGNFKEFVEFENESTRNLAMEVRRDELIKVGRKDLADTIRSGNGISELYTKNAASTKVLSDVQEIIDNISTTATIDEAKKDLKNSVDQLIYLLLPQQSMRKMFINRQAVQGASADMLRVFAMTSFHTAYQQSRFKFADAFLNNISNAQQYVDEKYAGSPNGAAYRDFILEVEKRNPQIMSNEDHSLGAVLSSKTSEVTFFYMLTSPATALVNILGFPQLVMSTLGGDYGYVKAYGIALNNLRRYGQSAGKRTVVPLATGNFLQVQFPSIFESGLLPPLEQKAADRFVSENDVNISLTSDIMGLSDSPSELYTGMYDKTKRFVSEPLHQSERMMREIGLLTAFQLAYEKLSKEPKRDLSGYILRDKNNQPIMRTQDEIFEDAIQEARDKIGLTLGDFNRQMKPRTMAIPGLNVLFIFKTFAIFASVYIARNTVAMFRPISKSEREDIRQLLIKDLKNAPNAQQIIDQRLGEIDAYLNTQRKEAFRRMAGVFGVATLLGGVEANPFFSMLGSILAMFLGPDDDEDEYFDWENWFRNYCETELGGYASDLLRGMGASEETAKKYGEDIGMSVARGPVGVMTGASLSDRVSLDLKNMWIRDPRYSRDARQEVYETAVAAAGPAAGLAMNFVDAYQFFQEGKIDRAMEKALPTFMSKPLVASRLAREGATTSSGRELIAEFSAWELALQAIGIQPERLAVKQKSVIEAETYKQKILDRKTAIMNRLWFEYENGSDADYEEAHKMKDKFNDMYPEVRITPKELKESFERRRDARRDAESFGANVPKKLRGRIEPMLEYGKTESEK